MLTRRRLLTAAAVAGPAALLLPGIARAAEPDLSTPERWLARFAAHRNDVSAVFDDGVRHRLHHLPSVARPLASAIKVVHLLAYATAVAAGRLDPAEPVRVGDWDARHPYLGDGPVGAGNHHTALTHLGIPCDEFGVAKDPERRVPLGKLAELMILVSDNSAADYLRARLGDRALRAAAARGGWPSPDVRMFSGETLLLFFPEYGPPPGSPVTVRRAAGDALSARFACDPSFRARVVPRATEQPPTEPDLLAWTGETGRGTAAQLAGLHHEIALGRDEPAELAREILGLQFAGHQPPVLFKGGSLPGALVLGVDLVWPDRRPGTGVVVLQHSTPADLEHADVLLRLGADALRSPATFTALEHALGH
ncbi:serine hydrolase [Amycolatopsis jejuensis]|uniref:serine hydrolase n=1 Tax=Amycolatopsis jejuensis TaxID=330084 RepID=UPI00052656C9|nr:serine hydrolase [Amycolatopsis jejuensis]